MENHLEDEFSDIAPYTGKAIRDAIERLKENKKFLDSIGEMVDPHWKFLAPVKRAQLKHQLFPVLDSVNTVQEFQMRITSDFALDAIISASMDAFTWSGLEHIDKDTAYLYFSNHRDIVLDCALLNFVLGRSGYKYTEIAIGDNLLLNQLATDLFKLNGGVTVKRTLPLREKFIESKRLSAYFVKTIIKDGRSMWVAQKSGRAKDGIDLTSPSIIKMLHMSQKDSGMKFEELLTACKIVPVAISYEFDPCDINKGRELLSHSLKGFYKKKKYEDLINILRGLKRYKGRVHLQVGRPVSPNKHDHTEVADEIDRQIHLGYHLWNTNYIAYDEMEQTDRFVDRYTQAEKKAFLNRYRDLSEGLTQMVLNSYANPVRMQLKALESGS